MNQEQIFNQAVQMFLHGKRRGEVVKFLNQNNIQGQEANDMATKAYLAVKDQRQQMIDEMPDYANDSLSDYDIQKGQKGKGGGMAGIGLGALFLIGGLIATMTTDRIWYGAILVGIVSLVSGLIKAAQK